MDTGADVSIIPAKPDDQKKKTTYKLYAANRTEINTYGYRSLELSLGLCRSLPWKFVVCDVPYAIIGADFLVNFNLIPHLRE